MLVLALDTSSAAVSAALVELDDHAQRVLAEHRIVNARGHGEYLAPMIAACLEGHAPTQLDAVVVGTGPGPFTGLRVGLVTAAVMSETLEIPAYGVCSLDGIARDERHVLVATDARRREVYWATYDGGVRIDGPSVDRPADIPTTQAAVMAGAGARLYADVLGLPLLDIDYPSAPALVTCAADRVRHRAPSDPLTPLYLRRPDAVEPGVPKPVSR